MLVKMTAYSPGERREIMAHICVLIIVDSFALIFNLLVVILFLRYRRALFECINNMFLFSVALADLFVGAFGILAQVLTFLFLVSRDLKSMALWKLTGVIPFFGSAFMSVFSIGIMTADRLISVQSALRYNAVMTTFKAKILIALAWVTTAAIIFIQGIIYLCISPETELTSRLCLTITFVFVGGTFLALANTKLHVMVSAKLRRTATMGSAKFRSRRDSKQHGTERTRVRVETTGSMKMKSQHGQKETVDEPRASTATSPEKTITQDYAAQNVSEISTRTRLVETTYAVKIAAQYSSFPSCAESIPPTNSLKTTTQPESRKDGLHLMDREAVNKSKVCIWMTVLFIISWGPFAVYCLVVTTTEFQGTFNLSTIFMGLASANSILNPIVYFAKRRNFRRYFVKFYLGKHIASLN